VPDESPPTQPAKTSNGMLIAALALSILMLFTPAGVFTGFGLALLTNLSIFAQKDLRTGTLFPIAGLLVLAITGYALVTWFT
jgi:hypothetical protein